MCLKKQNKQSSITARYIICTGWADNVHSGASISPPWACSWPSPNSPQRVCRSSLGCLWPCRAQLKQLYRWFSGCVTEPDLTLWDRVVVVFLGWGRCSFPEQTHPAGWGGVGPCSGASGHSSDQAGGGWEGCWWEREVGNTQTPTQSTKKPCC